MKTVKYTADGSDCSTENYEQDPSKYRGCIECQDCGEKAWFIRGFYTPKYARSSCFGAHHKDGCEDASTLIALDVEGLDDEPASGDIIVDLDKSSASDIYVSKNNDEHNADENSWGAKKNPKIYGNSSSFPLNKSLRQLLSNLSKNNYYATANDREIKVKADSGRIVLEGKLSEVVYNFEDLKGVLPKGSNIFWGNINNLNEDEQGALWLNCGNNFTEPSVLVEASVKNKIIDYFKIDDVSELDGSDVLVIGNAFRAKKTNKVLIRVAFEKYMAFRKYAALI